MLTSTGSAGPPGPSLSLSFVLATLRRRIAFVLAVAGVLTAVVAIVVSTMPDVYVAKTVVYLDTGSMPKSFEKAGVAPTKLDDILGTLVQEVTSRESLRELVNECDLYGVTIPSKSHEGSAPHERSGPEGLDDRILFASLIERARRDVKIEITKAFTEELVEVSVQARSPGAAARAVNRITGLLAAKNHEMKLDRDTQACAFLDGEVAKAQKVREERQASLFRFRDQHRETLPEFEPQLFAELNELRMQTYNRKREIDDSSARRASLELRIGPDGAGVLAGIAAPIAGDHNRALLEAQAERLEADAAAADATWRDPSFPDRVKAHAMATRARQAIRDYDLGFAVTDAREPQREPAPGRPSPSSPLAAVLPKTPGAATSAPAGAAQGAGGREGTPFDRARLLAELVRRGATVQEISEVENILSDIAMLAKRVEALERDQQADLMEIDRLEMLRASVAPTHVELQELEGTVEEAKRLHETRLADLWDAQKFLAAEKAMSGDQLRTVESAEMPLMPARPKRPLIAAVALLAGLVLAAGAACALELRREAYYSAAQVEGDLGLKVLALLPAVPNPEHLAAGEVFVVVD